jgi:hypothetical protein
MICLTRLSDNLSAILANQPVARNKLRLRKQQHFGHNQAIKPET